jgi:hypothetical protein
MGRRQGLDFLVEARQRFRFLVTDFGMVQRDWSGSEITGLQSLFYQKPGLMFGVHHEIGDGAARISVSISEPDRPAVDLSDVVEAAHFAPRYKVIGKAHSVEAILASLDDQSLWLRRLMPLLTGDGAAQLLETARAHPVDRAGNPRRRASNIVWRYPD